MLASPDAGKALKAAVFRLGPEEDVKGSLEQSLSTVQPGCLHQDGAAEMRGKGRLIQL